MFNIHYKLISFLKLRWFWRIVPMKSCQNIFIALPKKWIFRITWHPPFLSTLVPSLRLDPTFGTDLLEVETPYINLFSSSFQNHRIFYLWAFTLLPRWWGHQPPYCRSFWGWFLWLCCCVQEFHFFLWSSWEKKEVCWNVAEELVKLITY